MNDKQNLRNCLDWLILLANYDIKEYEKKLKSMKNPTSQVGAVLRTRIESGDLVVRQAYRAINDFELTGKI